MCNSCDPVDCSLPDFSDVGFSGKDSGGLPFPYPNDKSSRTDFKVTLNIVEQFTSLDKTV